MTRGSRITSSGVPSVTTAPSSNAIIRSEMEVMRGMSCSITNIEQPVSSLIRSSRGPSASVSRWAMPEDGSSRINTVGSWAMDMARSTMRRDPVDSSATNLSRKASRLMSSMRSSTV